MDEWLATYGPMISAPTKDETGALRKQGMFLRDRKRPILAIRTSDDGRQSRWEFSKDDDGNVKAIRTGADGKRSTWEVRGEPTTTHEGPPVF